MTWISMWSTRITPVEARVLARRHRHEGSVANWEAKCCPTWLSLNKPFAHHLRSG